MAAMMAITDITPMQTTPAINQTTTGGIPGCG
jgi:hypothetical protein